MSWTAKPRLNPTAPTVKPTGTAKPGPKTAVETVGNVRVSNGLKEFLWLLDGNTQGRILDLGAVFQTTVMFFIERGYRLSTEDMMRSWKEFLISEEEDNFHGVLAWDLFDYLDAELLPRVMERLYSILRPGGAVLASFHSKTPERFNRYKIVDGQTVELIPSPTLAVHSRIFQNREILDIFGKFRSSKTFVGRDQVREALFLK
jgi:hypothetical protein